MSDLEFVESVPRPFRQSHLNNWDEVTGKLAAQPGQWAIVARDEKYTALTAMFQGLQRRRVDVARRKLETGEYALYARWPEDV